MRRNLIEKLTTKNSTISGVSTHTYTLPMQFTSSGLARWCDCLRTCASSMLCKHSLTLPLSMRKITKLRHVTYANITTQLSATKSADLSPAPTCSRCRMGTKKCEPRSGSNAEVENVEPSSKQGGSSLLSRA